MKMPADRLLGTLIRSLQTYTDQQDTPRLLGSASSLLDSLQNPLNITLLASQLLVAPALWHRPDGKLHACLRLMGVFHAGAMAVVKREDDAVQESANMWYQRPNTGLRKEAWVKAIIAGADDRSPRWKHTIIYGGLLLGFGPSEEENIPFNLRKELEQELVKSVNFSLDEIRLGTGDLAGPCISLVLNHVFPIMPDFERAMLDYDRLLPILLGSTFFSSEGLEGAYFLAASELDIKNTPDQKLLWEKSSPSFHHLQTLLNKPLVSNLGPLSRLISHTVENLKDSQLIQTMVNDLCGFSKALFTQWRKNQFSSIHLYDEALHFAVETQNATTPQLWKLLRSCLYALIIVFRGTLGRMIGDSRLASDHIASDLVCQILESLKFLYFISSRVGTDSFSQYTFVYLTSIDILANYPAKAQEFLFSIAPHNITEISVNPLDRVLSLYFLNTAEHFTLIMPAHINQNLLTAAALPYISNHKDRHLAQLFEAAHSVMLSVFCAPQSSAIAAQHVPHYVDALFCAFPTNLTPRQFRLAFKTLLRVSSPPSTLSSTHPDLPSILLEMLHHRALTAPTTPIPTSNSPDTHPLSEQAVLVLALLDALPLLPPPLLDAWLPLGAQLVAAHVPPGGMRDACRARFWQVLVGGEMDPERALVAVAWWSGRGGREAVWGSEGDGVGAAATAATAAGAAGDGIDGQGVLMSGAVGAPEDGA